MAISPSRLSSSTAPISRRRGGAIAVDLGDLGLVLFGRFLLVTVLAGFLILDDIDAHLVEGGHDIFELVDQRCIGPIATVVTTVTVKLRHQLSSEPNARASSFACTRFASRSSNACFSFTNATCRSNAASGQVDFGAGHQNGDRLVKIGPGAADVAAALRERIGHRVGPQQIAGDRIEPTPRQYGAQTRAIKRLILERDIDDRFEQAAERAIDQFEAAEHLHMPGDLHRMADQPGEYRLGEHTIDAGGVEGLHILGRRGDRLFPLAVRTTLALGARCVGGEGAAFGREMLVEAIAEVAFIFLADRHVGDRRGEIGQPLLQAGALFGRVERAGGDLALPQAVDQRLGLAEQRLHRGSAARLHQIVGVLPLGKRDEGQAAAGREHGERAMRGPQRRLLPGAVAVEAEDRHVDHPPQSFELCLGQRSAERRDGFVDARLAQRDDVHIALDHQHAVRLARGGGGAVEVVERAALVEERRVGRVEVFGLAVADHAAAEGDHATAGVADRDHQPAAEAVVGILPLDLDQQAAFDERGVAIILQRGLQLAAAVGGKAHAEGAGGIRGDAALGEDGAGFGAADAVQLPLARSALAAARRSCAGISMPAAWASSFTASMKGRPR
ncbi:hypothetical protein WR25_00105 [Diploscapter pachys]|uniref:Uncharacterized protein n=1 Tax=Diploscapter pachys TaxID=2018661 RepID=A0A2A2K4X3_9BILA|nr:hypothetical protein WR25_00105 [Diploscapter pachys]